MQFTPSHHIFGSLNCLVAFHIYGDVIPTDLNKKYSLKPNYEAWMAYGRSKTANIYHAIALADRLKGTGLFVISVFVFGPVNLNYFITFLFSFGQE